MRAQAVSATKLDTKIDRLTKMTERGFAAMEKGFTAVAEDIGELRSKFHEFRNETNTNFRELRAEVAGVRRRLEELEGDARAIKGYSKEIDTLFARIKNIERRLGIVVK